MSNVLVNKEKIDLLANAISAKSGEPLTLTLDEMVEAVDGIETNPAPTLQSKTYTVDSAGTATVTADSGYDGLSSVSVSVPQAEPWVGLNVEFITENNRRKWRVRSRVDFDDGEPVGWLDENKFGAYLTYNAIPTGTTVTPTESTQTIGGADYMMEGAVTVNAIPSTYVGSGIVGRDVSDITVSGANVVVPDGYYEDGASVIVASGTAGTPTATKGTVSNHSVSVTPSVTNTTGYITGSTKTGTAVSVSASELVSGTVNITSSGNTDVTNYATASVASGSATASATKGTVSNHQVSVTPSVTRTAGYITAGSANGTAVTVSASELVSGSQTITQNGTVDVTNLASVTVNVSGGGSSGMQIGTATATPASAGSLAFTGLLGQPTSFCITSDSTITTGQYAQVSAIVFDGTNAHIQTITNTANAQVSYMSGSGITPQYSGGTLTLYTSGTVFVENNSYTLVYTYGGSSANIGTADVQVGSGATSITFTGLSDEPDYFSCIFKSDFSTSSGYQRVITVVYDGTDIYGLEMDSSAKYSDTHWSYSYNNGSLTISSQGTNAGGYFHQPGYYQLTYGVGGEAPEIETEPLSVTENGTYTAPRGKAYTPVTVNVSGGGASIDTKTVTNNSNTATTLSFTSMNGRPSAFFVRCTTQIQSSGSTNYYYVDNMRYNGTNTQGTYVRIGGTRGIYPDTTHYSYSYSGTTLTITTTGSRTGAGGSFYNGTYELVYVY